MTRGFSRTILAIVTAATAVVTVSFASPAGARSPLQRADSLPSSAAWLGMLPDGEEKRRFVLDCTGCHQLDAQVARAGGAVRTEAQWATAVARMLGFAGATTGFPVIAHDRDASATAVWLARHLDQPAPAPTPIAPALGWSVREYEMPVAGDLPHDVAVDSAGRILVTGMFTHRMYVLDSAGAAPPFGEIPIPVRQANPRAVEVDAAGNWWVVLGAPNQLARYAPRTGEWTTYDAGVYAHSVAIAPDGGVWFNGHFTRSPEVIGRIEPRTGAVETFAVPPHPALADKPGGPIPYEIRVAPDGRVWMGELQGNRIVVFDPQTRAFRAWELPTPHSGPRRFDIDSAGVLWIPAYAANLLVRFDPGTGRFEEIPLPIDDALPYVARLDQRAGVVWLGTAAADVMLRYDPRARTFTTIPLPSRGALVRHLAIDASTHDVWIAYGASPGRISARIARLRRLE